MPKYDYKCEKCEVKIEYTHSMHDQSPVICGICGQYMQKVIGNCSFVLKGGGWGRDLTEKNERQKRSEKMSGVMKEKEHYGEFQ